MRIAITGTHGTGKTTLVNSLKDELKFKNYFFDNNVTRWVHSLGFPINEQTNNLSQELNLIKRICNLNTYSNLIADRSIVDVMAYTHAGYRRNNIDVKFYLYLNDLYTKNVGKYNIIFRLEPEFEIEDDGVRATDKEYQIEIKNLIDQILAEHYLDGVEIINLSGSIEERKSKILKTMNIYKATYE